MEGVCAGKSEVRSPKSEGRPKPEGRTGSRARARCGRPVIGHATRNTQHATLPCPVARTAPPGLCAAPCPRRRRWPGRSSWRPWRNWKRKEVRDNASKMIGLVIEAGYEDYLEESYANYRSRLEDLEQLAVFARQFPTVEDFLTQLALLTNLEAEDEQPARHGRRAAAAFDDSPGQGAGVRCGVRDHAVRWAVPFRAVAGNGRGRGGRAAADVCGHHAGPE